MGCVTSVDGIKLPSIDVMQLTVTLKMTTAQVVETSVTVNNNSPIQDYIHLDGHTQPTYEINMLFTHLFPITYIHYP